MPLKRIRLDPMAFDACAELGRHKGLGLEGELALEDESLPLLRENVQAALESPHLLRGR